MSRKNFWEMADQANLILLVIVSFVELWILVRLWLMGKPNP